MIKTALLVIPALLMAAGGVMHLSAFRKAAAAAAGSNIPPFFGDALKALWVMDSCGMFVLAAVCVTLVARPDQASCLVVALLSLITHSTAALLYLFIGKFFPAHVLIVAAASMAAAAFA
jgi:hypothetical protein